MIEMGFLWWGKREDGFWLERKCWRPWLEEALLLWIVSMCEIHNSSDVSIFIHLFIVIVIVLIYFSSFHFFFFFSLLQNCSCTDKEVR